MALPVMSVDSIQDAEDLQILTCKRAYGYANVKLGLNLETGEMESSEPRKDHRYKISSLSGFVVDDSNTLDAAGEWLEEQYQSMKARLTNE